MSRHPENPWWHQQLDIPIMIQTRLEWEEAGHVLPEHVMQRLKNIADHVFDNETSAGFDEDGFIVSLTAEGLQSRTASSCTCIRTTIRHRMFTCK